MKFRLISFISSFLFISRLFASVAAQEFIMPYGLESSIYSADYLVTVEYLNKNPQYINSIDDLNSFTPLMLAIKNRGHVDLAHTQKDKLKKENLLKIITYLISKNADLEKKLSMYKASPENFIFKNIRALGLAIKNHDVQVVDLLVKAGADIKATTNVSFLSLKGDMTEDFDMLDLAQFYLNETFSQLSKFPNDPPVTLLKKQDDFKQIVSLLKEKNKKPLTYEESAAVFEREIEKQKITK